MKAESRTIASQARNLTACLIYRAEDSEAAAINEAKVLDPK